MTISMNRCHRGDLFTCVARTSHLADDGITGNTMCDGRALS